MKNVGADGATGFHRIKNKNQEVKKNWWRLRNQISITDLIHLLAPSKIWYCIRSKLWFATLIIRKTLSVLYKFYKELLAQICPINGKSMFHMFWQLLVYILIYIVLNFKECIEKYFTCTNTDIEIFQNIFEGKIVFFDSHAS